MKLTNLKSQMKNQQSFDDLTNNIIIEEREKPSMIDLLTQMTLQRRLDNANQPDFKDFMDMEEEFINSEDGSTLEGNINMTRNSIIFLPFKSLDDLKANKEVASKEYLAMINSLFNKDNEEQKQGNDATKVAISVTCTLVLMATCMFGWKRFKRSKPVTYLTIWQRPEEQQTKQMDKDQIH